jgi:hypothetical protein
MILVSLWGGGCVLLFFSVRLALQLEQLELCSKKNTVDKEEEKQNWEDKRLRFFLGWGNNKRRNWSGGGDENFTRSLSLSLSLFASVAYFDFRPFLKTD